MMNALKQKLEINMDEIEEEIAEEKKANFWKSPQGRLLIGTLLALILVFALFRSCSKTHVSLLKNTVIRVGIDSSWYPLTLYGKENNFVGFSSDLLSAISNASEIKLRPVVSMSSDLLQDVNNGSFDAALSFLQPGISNENQYVFSNPFYLLGPVLVVVKNSTIDSLQAMEGKTVGVREAYPLVFEVSYPSMQIATYENMNRALSDLQNNVIDGIIMDVLQANVQMSIFPDKFKVVTTPLSKEGLRLISLKNPKSEELVTLFNEGLDTVRKEGTYQQLLDKWNLYNTMN